MRNNRPGSIQAAVREVYTTFGGLEAVSDSINVSPATLSNGTDIERPSGLGVNYLDSICRMEPACAAVIAQHFAALAGGVFQPIDTTGMDASMLAHGVRMVRETGEASAAVMIAMGSSCPKLLDAADEEVEDVMEAGAALRAVIRAKREAKP